MEISKLTNTELKELLLRHHQKAQSKPNGLTQEEINEAWDAAYESLQRTQKRADRQEEQFAQLSSDMDDLIVTDITYRAAYKFIHEKGMQDEFEIFLESGIDEVLSNVIHFPPIH